MDDVDPEYGAEGGGVAEDMNHHHDYLLLGDLEEEMMIDPELGMGRRPPVPHHHDEAEEEEEDERACRLENERMFDIDLSSQGLKPDDCAFLAQILVGELEGGAAASSSWSSSSPITTTTSLSTSSFLDEQQEEDEEEEDEEMGLAPSSSSTSASSFKLHGRMGWDQEPYCRLLEFFPLLEGKVGSLGSSIRALELKDNMLCGGGDEGLRRRRGKGRGGRYYQTYGLTKLAQALTSNTTLVSLGLAGNAIGCEGVRILASYLHQNTTLKVLDLSRNMIGNVRPLAMALMSNNTTTSSMSSTAATMIPMTTKKKTVFHASAFSSMSSYDSSSTSSSNKMRRNRRSGLSSLDLSSNYILSEGLEALSEMLKVNTTLQHLNLANNLIARTRLPLFPSSTSPSPSSLPSSLLLPHDLAGLLALADAVEKNHVLMSCDLSGNQLWQGEASEEEERRMMMKTLRQLSDNVKRWNTRLTSLILNTVSLPIQELKGRRLEGGGQGAAAAAAGGGNDHDLNFSCAGLRNDDVLLVSYLMEANDATLSLSLHANDLEPWAIEAVAYMMKINKTLVSLDLSGTCTPTTHGPAMKAIAQALYENQTLTSLNLRWNGLNPSSLEVLAKALNENKTLTSLDLSCNRIGGYHDHALNAWISTGECVLPLAKALEVNETLTNLDLANNGVGSKAIAFLAFSLHHRNQTLSRLSLRSNMMMMTHGDEEEDEEAEQELLLLQQQQLQLLPAAAFLPTALAAAGQVAAAGDGGDDMIGMVMGDDPNEIDREEAMLEEEKAAPFRPSSTASVGGGAFEIAQWLASPLCHNLVDLSLGDNDLQGKDLMMILEALGKNHSLKRFDISCNGPWGTSSSSSSSTTTASAAAAASNNDDGSNERGTSPLHVLAASLRQNNVLEVLDLVTEPQMDVGEEEGEEEEEEGEGVPVEEEDDESGETVEREKDGILALARAIGVYNRSLKVINLSGTKIPIQAILGERGKRGRGEVLANEATAAATSFAAATISPCLSHLELGDGVSRLVGRDALFIGGLLCFNLDWITLSIHVRGPASVTPLAKKLLNQSLLARPRSLGLEQRFAALQICAIGVEKARLHSHQHHHGNSNSCSCPSLMSNHQDDGVLQQEYYEEDQYDEEIGGSTRLVLPLLSTPSYPSSTHSFLTVKEVLGRITTAISSVVAVGKEEEQQRKKNGEVNLKPEDLFRLISSEVIPYASERRAIRCTFYP